MANQKWFSKFTVIYLHKIRSKLQKYNVENLHFCHWILYSAMVLFSRLLYHNVRFTYKYCIHPTIVNLAYKIRMFATFGRTVFKVYLNRGEPFVTVLFIEHVREIFANIRLSVRRFLRSVLQHFWVKVRLYSQNYCEYFYFECLMVAYRE